MNTIIPEKLKKGDEIRVIAPSRNMNILKEDTIEIATKRLQDLGFIVSFSENIKNEEDSNFGCASIKDRVEDIHNAFNDKNVKAILAVLGGYNVNQILDYIDYDLIKNNPKIICGFSDITALLNSIYAKTGLVTYYGPNFSNFGMKQGFEYTFEYFKKIIMNKEDIKIKSSDKWSDDKWFMNQEERIFYKNEGITVINSGKTSGKIIGGNLCTLNLLQGTEYMPDLDNSVLFIEDDDLVGDEYLKEFDRNLQSLLHCCKNKNIKGIVFGRAQINSKMTVEKWKSIIKTKEALKNIPIIINADFGHTTPIFTFPIGGFVEIDNENIIIKNEEI